MEVGSRWLASRARVDDVRTKEAGPVLRYSQGQVKRLTAKLEADAAPKVTASIEADDDGASREPDAGDTTVDVGMVQAPESHEGAAPGAEAAEDMSEADATASQTASSAMLHDASSETAEEAAMQEMEVAADASTDGPRGAAVAEASDEVETDSQARTLRHVFAGKRVDAGGERGLSVVNTQRANAQTVFSVCSIL